MRNPYIVGRWLKGNDHYGRHKLMEHLLTTTDQAIWLVGTRRIAPRLSRARHGSPPPRRSRVR